jgi:hypothetical protein
VDSSRLVQRSVQQSVFEMTTLSIGRFFLLPFPN